MVAWWDQLEPILKLLYCVAVPATLILIIQTILSVAGGFESGTGVDVSDTSGLDFSGEADIGELADASDLNTDASGDGSNPSDFSLLRLFTLQGIVTFLTVFGWSSIVAVSTGAPVSLSIIIGLVLGFVAMFAVAKLVQLSTKLTENGTLNYKNAIGESAKVYIPIPANGLGEGKITLQIQGSFVECSAISFENETLATGTCVRVVDVRNGTLVVEEERLYFS